MDFELPKDEASIIKVIGVGGGGGNAVNHMYSEGIKGVDFIVCNTDLQALDISPVPHKIQLGPSLTEGRGAGSLPEIGKNAAVENIDEIIKTIKASKTKDDAREALMQNFQFSKIQAEAILEMKLNKLAGLERQKIEDELNEKLLLIADLKDILAKPERIVGIIGEELDEVKTNFGDDRRTQVNA